MRPLAIPLLCTLSALGLSAAPPAQGCFRAADYTMEILVDGRPLPALSGRGATYVEASRGREYAVRLTNNTGQRIAAALSVDGLNVIDAKRTSAREARKWILDPWQSITLDGWQVSAASARRFVFTTEEKSYGTWLGRTADLGVISAAFFRERRPVIAPAAPITGEAAPEASAKSRADAREHAGTGIGREVEHRVVQVDFDEEPSPASVVSVRYEYRDALVRLGVLPAVEDALTRRERATGFTGGFAPDPYRK